MMVGQKGVWFVNAEDAGCSKEHYRWTVWCYEFCSFRVFFFFWSIGR